MFSKELVLAVKEHFGSEMSPLLRERLEDGTHRDWVVDFLRDSIPAASWDLFGRTPFHDLKVMAARACELQALVCRAASEVSIHQNNEIQRSIYFG